MLSVQYTDCCIKTSVSLETVTNFDTLISRSFVKCMLLLHVCGSLSCAWAPGESNGFTLDTVRHQDLEKRSGMQQTPLLPRNWCLVPLSYSHIPVLGTWIVVLASPRLCSTADSTVSFCFTIMTYKNHIPCNGFQVKANARTPDKASNPKAEYTNKEGKYRNREAKGRDLN